jgi:hypothetical protein
MALKVTKMKVWVAEIKDQAGGLAACLDTLAAAGANLECLIARRQTNRPRTGAVFLTPLTGRKVVAAAAKLGFHAAQRVSTLKVEGRDRPGVGADIAHAVGAAGVNMRAATALVVGRKFVGYFGFDRASDAAKAAKAIRRIGAR